MQSQTSILLVAPPMHHPAFFPPAYCRTAAVLRQRGFEVYAFHGGADFTAYLLRPEVQEELAARARGQVQKGLFAAADSATAILTAAYTHEAQSRPDLIAESAILADMQTEAFYDPLKAAAALQRIDRACTMVSLAYPPLVIDRRGFSHPALQDAADLLAWTADAERNPFLAYARHGCRPPVAPEQCDRIVLVVDAPGQFAGALTLAQVWGKRAPRAAITLLAGDERLRGIAERLSAGLDRPAGRPQAADWMPPDQLGAAAEPADAPDVGALLLPAAAAASARPSQIPGGLLQAGDMASALTRPASATGGVLVWRDPEGELPDLSALLFQAAKKGFWNHVVLPDQADLPIVDQLLRFAAANPNIIHSWCRRSRPASIFSDPRDSYPEGNPPYGATRPLPGTPLWQRLQDPVYLDAYAARQGAKSLARLFVMPDGRSVHAAGSRMSFHFVPPAKLPPGYLDEIVRMVEAGGSVQTQYVRYNLERAYMIGYVEENGIIIGDSSLKHPREEYIEAVGRQTGIDLNNYLERGYTSVRPEYRSLGVGAKLLEGLTERVEGYKVYSIIAEDNVATQKMAIRNRTRKVATFYSQRSGKTISVWIPEWMLPEGIVLPPQPDVE